MVLGTGGRHRRLPGAPRPSDRTAALGAVAAADRAGSPATSRHHGAAVAHLDRAIRAVSRRAITSSSHGTGSSTAPSQP